MRKLIWLTVLLAFPSVAFAAPSLVQFQGVLLDNAGEPLDGEVAATFRLFAEPIGGSALWSETHAALFVSQGVFNVLLGSVKPLDADRFGADARWLEVEVGGEVQAPRQRITSVPFALESERLGGRSAEEYQLRVDRGCAPGQFLQRITAEGAPVCGDLIVSGSFNVQRNNTGGTTSRDLGSTIRRMCFLTEVTMEDTDSGGEWAGCRVVRLSGQWVLQARLARSDDADVWCAARCLSW